MRLFKSAEHYCSAPHALKDLKCAVKGQDAPAGMFGSYPTLKSACGDTRLVELQQPVSADNVVDATRRKEKRDAKLRTLREGSGVVLHHSSPGARARGMWCKTVQPAAVLTTAEAATAARALTGAAAESPVYNNNDAPATFQREVGPDYVEDHLTVYGALCKSGAVGAMLAAEDKEDAEGGSRRPPCPPAPALAPCLPLPLVRTARVNCGGLDALGAVGVTIAGVAEKATIACTRGTLTTTVEALGAPDRAPCHRADSELGLGAQSGWPAMAVQLALARARKDEELHTNAATRAALRALAARSSGIPHALRPFAWTLLARDPAWLTTNASWFGTERAPWLNPSKEPLDDFFRSVVGSAANAAEECAGKGFTRKKCCSDASYLGTAPAPCPGFELIVEEMTVTADAFYSSQAMAAVFSEGIPSRGFPTPEWHDAIALRLDGERVGAEDKARVAAFTQLNSAIEVAFARGHQGTWPTRHKNEETDEWTSQPPVFFLAATLPLADAFLVRAYMLSELLLGPVRGKEAEKFPPKLRVRSSVEVCEDDINDEAFDDKGQFRALVAAALEFCNLKGQASIATSPMHDLDWFANYGSRYTSDRPGDWGRPVYRTNNKHMRNRCVHEANFLQSLLWRSADAEPAYRITDLALALPADAARQVPKAGMDAYYEVFVQRLKALRLRPDRMDNLACERARLLALLKTVSTSEPHAADGAPDELFSPPFAAWLASLRAGLRLR